MFKESWLSGKAVSLKLTELNSLKGSIPLLSDYKFLFIKPINKNF